MVTRFEKPFLRSISHFKEEERELKKKRARKGQGGGGAEAFELAMLCCVFREWQQGGINPEFGDDDGDGAPRS